MDHCGQPMAMFRYGCLKSGLDDSKINFIDAGSPEEMEVAFRSGVGDYIHAQGPLPQQFEKDGLGQIVAEEGAHLIEAFADRPGLAPTPFQEAARLFSASVLPAFQ